MKTKKSKAQRTVITGACVITLDSTPDEEAVLIEDEEILQVGSRNEVLESAGADARIVNLDGGVILPGFHDNHIHAVGLGNWANHVKLDGLNENQIVEKLREEFSDTRRGRLILAVGWDYGYCTEPHREILDEAFPDNPVILIQFSGHGMWVNSLALKKMKIDSRSPDPRGGKILRDENGEPTGVLRDAHENPYFRRSFWSMHFKPRLNMRCLERCLELFREAGITSVGDNTWFYPTVWNLRKLYKRGDLTCRFSCWRYGQRPALSMFMGVGPYASQWYAKGPWKYFLDGAFSSRSAWLTEDYADDSGNSGLGNPSLEIEKILKPFARRGEQAAFHAIGDRAIKEFLDALERLVEIHPQAADARFRLEHAQLIRPEDIERLAKLGVLIAAQPHAIGHYEKDERLLGPERARRAYPYRSLIDAGVHVSFGSDAPAESTFEPLVGIQNVVDREGPEAIGVEEALRCYTVESAYAEHLEDRKGRIRQGMNADLVALSKDPRRVAPSEIGNIEVVMTVSGGRCVYTT